MATQAAVKKTISSGRREQVRKESKKWRASLIDVSGQNRLLYFKDLKVGTLDVTNASSSALRNLGNGETVLSTQLFTDPLDVAAAQKSLKTIHAKARTAAEEFGLNVGYQVTGFATWNSPGGPGTVESKNGKEVRLPNAPVLLRPLTLQPRPAAPGLFDIQVGTEIRINPVMLHLLRETFSLSFDEATFLEQHGDSSFDRIFEQLTSLVSDKVSGFSITNRSVMANLVYTGQAMVEDLSEEQLDFLAANDFVAALAGDQEATEAIRNAGQSVSMDAPDIRPPSDEHLVLDADASQSYVVNATLAGQNIVVQGPPGTGKSQTIANLIAELIAQQKTVLFVAQKRAAITAVLRRLDEVGLGNVGLDLFEASKSRKAVISAIGQSMDARKLATRPNVGTLHTRLTDSRSKLVDHGKATQEVRAPWHLPLLGYVDRESGEEVRGLLDWAIATEANAGIVKRLPMSLLHQWDNGTHENMRSAIAELFDKNGLVIDSASKPGWSEQYLESMERVQEGAEIVGAILDEQLPATISAIEAITTAFAFSKEVNLDTPSVTALLRFAERLYAQQQIAPKTLNASVVPADALLRLAGATGNANFRNANGQRIGFLERRKLRKQAHELIDTSLSDAVVHSTLCEAGLLRQECTERGATLPPPDISQLPVLREPLEALLQSIERLHPYLQGVDLSAYSWTDLEQRLAELRSDRARNGYPRLKELRDEAQRRCGDSFLKDLTENPPGDGEIAADRLTFAFANAIIEHIETTDLRVAGVTADDLTRSSNAFTKADNELREANSARVRREAADSLRKALEGNPVEADLIRHQLKRKRGFKAVRELFESATSVMLGAKPLWAMSPQNASELLPAAQLFDVIIFDEASQILPAAAIPAIARARQVVVAGDSLQLPPTTLFTRTVEALYSDEEEPVIEVADDDDTEFEESYKAGIVADDLESILDAIELKLGPQRSRYLAWHYRSQDERLIATSNEYVYRPEHRLMTTFPSAKATAALTHDVVEPSSGLGKNNKSPVAEVQHVAHLVQLHANTRSESSLGVIAFGSEHANRIEMELDRRANEDFALREFIDASGSEPFFVKNIERVQGDERDRIILTVGYAKTDDGKLSYRWGPVQNEGGHRRVNVAISRAKQEMNLVTSFAADEVNESASSAKGFHLMTRFINYASSEGKDFGDEGVKDIPLNPFEGNILQRLLAAGLDVVPQWGAGGYRIDFAVRHPEIPGRFVLAIEADGASYHSGYTARERDRLRQQLLEARGWRFVRIWSTDWFRDPEPQLQRVMAAYREAVDEITADPATPNKAASSESFQPEPLREGEPAAGTPSRGNRPSVRPGLKIAEYSDAELRRMVRWILSDDILHTRDEVYELVKSELGFARNGKNIQDRIRAAIEHEMKGR